MKVRWREHEAILATMVAAILLAGNLWMGYHPALDQTANALPCLNNPASYNLFRNFLIPHIGMGLLIYLSYLFVNLFTVRRLIAPKKFREITSFKIATSLKKIVMPGLVCNILKKYLWVILQVGLLMLLLGIGFNIANYYRNECYFNYPGFTFFPKKGYHPLPQMDITNGFWQAFLIVALYALYVFVREVIIHFIEISERKRAYRTLICNQVTAFLIPYILIPFIVASFPLTHNGDLISAYFTFILPVFLVFMSNTYWIFPLTGNWPFFSGYVMGRLLVSTFICTLPAVITPFHEGFGTRLLANWAIQLFVITPITWLLFQQRKDKILQLRGAEKALVKSKADLQFLRSQINPHFLFNMLNTIYGTALQENAERTSGAIQKLGDMMRFMLHENTLDFIQMDREVEYLKNYISLQKLRTQSSPEIIIEDNIGEQDCNHKIAPMLLIPLVENAFKHGISLEERSWIKINLNCNNKEIVFEVFNSMHPKDHNDPEKERSGIGLKNVLERLKLVYPGKHQISVNGDGKEFFVQLAIQP
jgi:hypothetical protein